MYPFYGNIDPHWISSLGGGDHFRGFNDNSIRDRANSRWVQHEETLIMDGESNVATPRCGGPSMAVPSSSPALNSQEYYNLIVYRDVMYPYYGNIDRIPREGGDYPGFNGNNTRIPWRSPPNPSWVQYEVTLILDEHGESNVATLRHGDPYMEAMITKNLKTKSCCNVLAKDEDGVPKICAVCQEDLCHGEEEIGILDCRHEYHACCIKNWLVRKNVCPLCNATVVKVD